MNINVLGSTGFIGPHLLKNLEGSRGVSLRSASWKEELDGAEVVVNLVGKAHDHKGKASESDYVHANVDLAKEVFQAFRDSETARVLIHVSSLAAVEEFESESVLTEDAECRPVSVYGRTKRAAEEWLLEQALSREKKLIILRPPMVHGPGDKGNLGLLYGIVSKGIPYPLAAFDNKRTFISVDNFCFFIQQIIAKYDRVPSGIYHIADDEALSTNELIRLIGEVRGRNVKLWRVPKGLVRLGARFGDVLGLPLTTLRLRKLTSTLLVSNGKIKAALGLGEGDRLPLSAREGLRKTLGSF